MFEGKLSYDVYLNPSFTLNYARFVPNNSFYLNEVCELGAKVGLFTLPKRSTGSTNDIVYSGGLSVI